MFKVKMVYKNGTTVAVKGFFINEYEIDTTAKSVELDMTTYEFDYDSGGYEKHIDTLDIDCSGNVCFIADYNNNKQVIALIVDGEKIITDSKMCFIGLSNREEKGWGI